MSFAGLDAFTYIPPFRGRAIRMIRRDLPFKELENRLRRTRTPKGDGIRETRPSRQLRPKRIPAGSGRFCGILAKKIPRPADIATTAGKVGHSISSPLPQGEEARADAVMAAEEIPTGKVLEAVRMVLSGVARTQARFPCGKTIIAQMLCGSKSAKMQQLRMDTLSTYGLLKHLQQTEVTLLIDALVSLRCLLQEEIEKFRPVVKLTDFGTTVMKGTSPLEMPLPIPLDLLRKIRGDKDDLSSPSGKEGPGVRELSYRT